MKNGKEKRKKNFLRLFSASAPVFPLHNFIALVSICQPNELSQKYSIFHFLSNNQTHYMLLTQVRSNGMVNCCSIPFAIYLFSQEFSTTPAQSFRNNWDMTNTHTRTHIANRCILPFNERETIERRYDNLEKFKLFPLQRKTHFIQSPGIVPKFGPHPLPRRKYLMEKYSHN